MDDWQTKYFDDCEPKLLDNVFCSSKLLSLLVSARVIVKDDRDAVERIHLTTHDRVSLLLKRLKVRTGAYEKFANALYQTGQTKALIILLEGFEQANQDEPFNKCGIDLDIEELLQKEIMFQGKQTKLRGLIGTGIPQEDLKEIFKRNLNSVVYSELLHPTCSIQLVKDTVPAPLPYYVTRSLSVRNGIDPAVFTELMDDVFVIENISKSELRRLTWDACRKRKADDTVNREQIIPPKPQNGLDTSTNQIRLKFITFRFILLDKKTHFHKLANESPFPVHWLSYEKSKDGKEMLKLVTSNKVSDFQNITKHMTPQEDVWTQSEFMENIICSSSNNSPQIFCISDTPGMGKTALVADIARTIKKEFPERVVLFFELSQFIPLCQDTKAFDYEKITNVLISMASTNPVGQSLLRKLMSLPFYKTELFFDGLDEVSPELLETAKKILTIILDNKCVTTRIFVTTRPHRRHELQKVLSTYAYNIEAFQEADQLKFLVNFWQSECKNEGSEDYLKKFASCALSNLKVRDRERDTAGIPMLCRLLAEVYLEEVKDSIRENCSSSTEVNLANPVKTIFGMYQRHLENCFAKIKETSSRSIARDLYRYEATKLLFPAIVSSFPRQAQISDTDMFKVGLMEAILTDEQHPRFVHRTIAEYMVAELLALCIVNEETFPEIGWLTSPEVVSLLFQTALHSSCAHLEDGDQEIFVHDAVAFFFNEQINTQQISGKEEPFQTIFSMSEYNNPKIFYNLISCTIYHDSYDIYSFLHNLMETDITLKPLESSSSSGLNWFRLLEVAAAKSSFNLFNVCRAFVERVEKMPVQEYWDVNSQGDDGSYVRGMFEDACAPMLISISRGNYEIFSYLFGIYEDKLPQLSLLYECVIESTPDPKLERPNNDRFEMIQTLVQFRKESFGDIDPTETMSLLSFSAIVGNMQIFDYFWKEYYKDHLERLGGGGFGIIHACVKSSMDSPENLIRNKIEMLKTLVPVLPQEFLTEMDKDGKTPLHISVSSLGNYQIFKHLIENYYNSSIKLSQIHCLVHDCVEMSSIESDEIAANRVNIVKTVVTLRRDCLEERDEDFENTPLLMREIHWSVLQCLLEEGAYIFAVNKQKFNVAQTAASYLTGENYHKLVVELLAKSGHGLFNNSNIDDNPKFSPVHRMLGLDARTNCDEMWDKARIETLRLLSKEAGVSFNNEDEDGNTEFMKAVKAGKGKEFLECMIELGADWKWENKLKATPLHIACYENNEEAAVLLLSKEGVNPNARDKLGETPLHYFANGWKRKSAQSVLIGKLLLERGADWNAVEGCTVVQIAQKRGPKMFLDLILEYENKLVEQMSDDLQK